MRDDLIVTGLVTRAQNGDQQAWDALVERYAPLVWSICRRYQLGNADAEDVSQNVWLRLVDRLGSLRDPAAIPGWLATTAQRECARAVRVARSPRVAAVAPEVETIPDVEIGMAEEELLIAERHAALREAFSDLPPCCQQLIALLIEDPPVPYAQISARLGIPVGGIGPSRRRCLDRLRRHPAIVALIDAEGHAKASSGPTQVQ
jgi:RNA polymerase sigma factor (sigma-70 family)